MAQGRVDWHVDDLQPWLRTAAAEQQAGPAMKREGRQGRWKKPQWKKPEGLCRLVWLGRRKPTGAGPSDAARHQWGKVVTAVHDKAACYDKRVGRGGVQGREGKAWGTGRGAKAVTTTNAQQEVEPVPFFC